MGWYLYLLHYSREELVGRTGCCQTAVIVKGLDLLPFRKSQQYDCKWYIPLTDLSFQMVDESEAVPNIPLVPDEELDAMKIKISQIKNDIQREKVKELSTPWQCRRRVCAHMRRWWQQGCGVGSQAATGALRARGFAPLSAQPGRCCPGRRHTQKDPVLVPSKTIYEHPCRGQGSFVADMRRTGSVICQFLAVKL